MAAQHGTTRVNWILVKDKQAIAAQAVEKILCSAQKAISDKGVFTLVLAGGSTPGCAYELLATQDQDWSCWQFYFGDERCLPAEDSRRNSQMVAHSLFRHIALTEDQIHIIAAEKGAEVAAKMYEQELTSALPFDMVLLGLGEDGHTASLFPGQQYPENSAVVAVYDAPKPPPERVSLNYPTLQAAATVLFLVSGEGKAIAVRKWRNGEDIPAARFTAAEVLIDEAAWYE